MSDDLDRARREAAELLGLNPSALAPGDALRCELIAALRACVDDELSRVTSSRSGDLAKLIVAVEQLTKFLADAKPQAEAEDDGEDPRESLMRIVEGWIAAEEQEKAERAAERREKGLSEPMADLQAAQARIDQLEAELARLRGEDPRGEGPPITPSESEIDKPIDGEIIEPDPPKPKPAPPTTAEAAQRAGLRPARHDEPWRPFVGRFL